jgi:hypothetical protein
MTNNLCLATHIAAAADSILEVSRYGWRILVETATTDLNMVLCNYIILHGL